MFTFKEFTEKTFSVEYNDSSIFAMKGNDKFTFK